MKKSFYLTLALTFIAGALAKADDMTITIKKSSDTMATVAAVPESKGKACKVPIAFDSGASWDNVKDTYTVSPGTADGLMSKSETISIGTDGTATFHSMKTKKMMKK
jgi:hypothetical protein